MKKPETSKVIAYAMMLVIFPAVFLLSWKVIELAELAITMRFTGALPYLTAIITPAWAAVTTILCFYFNKAKAENKEKIKLSTLKRD
jgi:hypothetical protein